MSQGSPIREDEPTGNGDVRSDVSESCGICHGTEGHHHMRCPNMGKENKTKIDKVCASCGAVEGMEHEPTCDVLVHDELPPAKSGEFSQDEIAEHFATADKLFAGKKFEDGAVVEEDFDEHKVPPDAVDMASNNFLWLVAKLTYEVNRVYCQSIGDHSFVAWDEAPEWQRETNFKGVEFHFENPDATPRDSHNSWMREKQDDGWEYGPVKDETAKQHPCLVPYNQLPPAQQYKDALFSTICKTFFGSAV